MNIEPRYFQLPGLRMHALTCGAPEKPPIVLLHGFPELAESWRDILPVLAAAGYYAVAPDLRGYGKTDRPEEGYDLPTLSSDIAALIEAIGPRRSHVVAHDWGGALAYHLAAHRPELVDRLVVIASPYPSVLLKNILKPAQLARSWYIFFFQLPYLPERFLASQGGKWVARIFKSNALSQERFTRERLRPYVEHFRSREAASAAVGYYREAFRSLLRPSRQTLPGWWPKIRAPFRLIWSKHDLALGPELTRGYEKYFELPIDIVWLENAGHFCLIETPEHVASLVLEHLQPCSGTVVEVGA